MTFDCDVLVVGGGPVGLAAAIDVQRTGAKVRVIEAGALCDTVRRFPVYMTFFSEAKNIEIGGHPMIANGMRPSRKEALAYYQRVAEVEHLDVRSYTRVTAIEPLADGASAAGFRVRLQPGDTTRAGHGVPRREPGEMTARFVIVATGYFDQPERLDVPGADLPHVALRYDEAAPFWGQRVVIVGGSNGAVEAALDLYRGGAHVTLVHRKTEVRDGVKYWLKPDFTNRVKEGSIAARMPVVVRSITPRAVEIETLRRDGGATGECEFVPADFVLVQIGYRAVDGLLRDTGVKLTPDGKKPVLTAAYETSRPGLFVVGSAGFGRDTRTVFIENGRDHAKAVAAEIARRTRG